MLLISVTEMSIKPQPVIYWHPLLCCLLQLRDKWHLLVPSSVPSMGKAAGLLELYLLTGQHQRMLLLKATSICFQSEVSGAAGIHREEPGVQADLHCAKQHGPPVLPFSSLFGQTGSSHAASSAAAAAAAAQHQAGLCQRQEEVRYCNL